MSSTIASYSADSAHASASLPSPTTSTACPASVKPLRTSSASLFSSSTTRTLNRHRARRSVYLCLMNAK